MPESWTLAQSLSAAMHGFVAQLLAFFRFQLVKPDELVRVQANKLLRG